ncbi:type I phosphomannose isomerase catalytic subunit [Clostridium celatum]|uniref:type I phosphomannose isomerase catalytic subunit n=1 Tax=Clostridium celatum TaxID=36834 RepID=UPI0028FE3C4A|nr:type I phosphomannose isomerase catalytic subunit [Clostridium celatum]MDU2265196.1 type I phosphomannose isomerase catalytic subunit [Clostridium celatum]MDU6295922.1 type I phosphomannose isomerase catalytic subunit [Clostridium celatum]
MYPIRFENLYYNKIWGGRGFENFRDNMPEGEIGESWDIACHPNGIGIVANGELKGKRFDEIISEFGHDLVGSKVSTEKFPLLVKLINSKEKLSVQVHPGDEYAKRVENEFGKTEAWYVVDAKPGAKLIVGTKNCNKATFAKAIEEGKSEDYLNVIEVKKGDCFLINSGLVHAICEGLIIAEIQQNSDVTYRVYDYGRPREIHVEKSLDVINFDLAAENLSNHEVVEFEGFSKINFCENEYFGMQKFNIKKEWTDCSNEEKFFILTCVDGKGTIEGKEFSEEIKMGDSYLIPAKLGNYSVKGELEVIKSYPM